MTAHDQSAVSAHEPAGEVGGLNAVTDFDAPSLTAMITRLERSHSLEHLAYREAELDEIWRLLDGALQDACWSGMGADAVALLRSLKTLVFKVHDLVGVDSDPQAAAAELRSGLFLTLSYSNLRA